MTNHPLIRLAVIDSHPMMSEGIALTLHREANLKLVAFGQSDAEAIHIAKTFLPHIMIIGINIPEERLTLVKQIIALQPDIKIMLLTVSEERDDVVAAFGTGVRAYMSKQTTPADLVAAIAMVVDGKTYISPNLAAHLLAKSKSMKVEYGKRPMRRPSDLSVGETQVLNAVALGLTNKEIAGTLVLSPKTIKNRMTGIFGKLNVRNRVEAIFAARKRNYP